MTHGKRWRYNRGCHCPDCRRAVADARQATREHLRELHRNHFIRRVGDIDEVAVERVCNGDRTILLNRSELLAAFTYLDGRGFSALQIAARLGVTDRTICRWRQTVRGEPELPYGVAS